MNAFLREPSCPSWFGRATHDSLRDRPHLALYILTGSSFLTELRQQLFRGLYGCLKFGVRFSKTGSQLNRSLQVPDEACPMFAISMKIN